MLSFPAFQTRGATGDQGMTRQRSLWPAGVLLGIIAIFLPPGVAGAQTRPPIVQPGPPGEASKVISPEEASNLASLEFSEADLRFVHGMISHHAQAIEMVQLLTSRTERDAMQQLGKRIQLSQEDEIRMMQDWLRAHGQQAAGTGAHQGHGEHLMPGMLTAEQMAALASILDCWD
jgi:uncharacterized protein (DUF305 family)